jgi:hypothetical protein
MFLKTVHQQLLMIGGDVGALEHRRHSNCAGATSLWGSWPGCELEQLPLGVHHERLYAVRDGTEVVVVELLTLGRLGAERGAPGV